MQVAETGAVSSLASVGGVAPAAEEGVAAPEENTSQKMWSMLKVGTYCNLQGWGAGSGRIRNFFVGSFFGSYSHWLCSPTKKWSFFIFLDKIFHFYRLKNQHKKLKKSDRCEKYLDV